METGTATKTSRAPELEDALREVITERMDEMSILEAQHPKNGLSVPTCGRSSCPAFHLPRKLAWGETDTEVARGHRGQLLLDLTPTQICKTSLAISLLAKTPQGLLMFLCKRRRTTWFPVVFARQWRHRRHPIQPWAIHRVVTEVFIYSNHGQSAGLGWAEQTFIKGLGECVKDWTADAGGGVVTKTNCLRTVFITTPLIRNI